MLRDQMVEDRVQGEPTLFKSPHLPLFTEGLGQPLPSLYLYLPTCHTLYRGLNESICINYLEQCLHNLLKHYRRVIIIFVFIIIEIRTLPLQTLLLIGNKFKGQRNSGKYTKRCPRSFCAKGLRELSPGLPYGHDYEQRSFVVPIVTR